MVARPLTHAAADLAATLLTDNEGSATTDADPDPPRRWQGTFVTIVVALSGTWMLAVGLWALFAPRSFATWIDFPPYAEHLLHDVGAFQIGIGLACWSPWGGPTPSRSPCWDSSWPA